MIANGSENGTMRDRNAGPADVGDLMRRILPSMSDLSAEQWDTRDESARRVLERDAARKQEALRRHELEALAENGLSVRHVNLVAGGSVQETAATRAIATIHMGIVVLAGGVGCGKTTAAHVWLLPLGQPLEPHRVAFVSAQEFARTSRYEGKIERLRAPDRLVIDDLGAEYMDERGSALVDLDELIDARWRAGRGTLLTTNLTAQSFKRRYGARLASRIRDEGGWHQVDGPDLRGRRQ